MMLTSSACRYEAPVSKLKRKSQLLLEICTLSFKSLGLVTFLNSLLFSPRLLLFDTVNIHK